ncbi:hypothetical protein BC829DRAFT_397253 [Chytridium lagenaria]|nr:hypothetical protein BC829DRAFT_397253 [Chytridium lagenaria]
MPPLSPSGLKKDAHDVAASTLVQVSRGTINGLDASILAMRSGGTGYSKNVLPYVEYDRDVDEGKKFSTAPWQSVTVGITPMVSSGFTRLPKFPVTEDGTSHREKESQMKSSYAEKRLRFKDPIFDKRNIIPCDSAFINDVGEIKSLGTSDDDSKRFAPLPGPSAPVDWRTRMPARMKDDGYSRSTRQVDPLKRDPYSLINTRLNEDKSIRRRDPAEWVHSQDPRARQSHSRVIHVPLDPLDAVRAAHDTTTSKIGIKEPTGAVQNNPKFVFVSEPAPAERFSTETERRFQAPVDPFSYGNVKCDQITNSGFTSGNNFHYTHKAKTDAEIYGSMHPTVAKHNWIRERGLHTVKPNRNNLACTLSC